MNRRNFLKTIPIVSAAASAFQFKASEPKEISAPPGEQSAPPESWEISSYNDSDVIMGPDSMAEAVIYRNPRFEVSRTTYSRNIPPLHAGGNVNSSAYVSCIMPREIAGQFLRLGRDNWLRMPTKIITGKWFASIDSWVSYG